MIPSAMAQTLDDDELIQVAAELSKTMQTEGWQRFMNLLRKFEEDAALKGLRDETKSRDYYIGFVDALSEIRGATEYLVSEGIVTAKAKSTADRTFAAPRIDSAVSGA